MSEPDAIMSRIGQGIELGQQGEHGRARQSFSSIWDDIGADGNPLHRCTVAHSMADVQDDVREELVWDLRALEAAEEITDEQVRRAGMPGPARALYPSLHLNLADAYRKLGQRDLAREHLERGRATTDALGDDGYSQMIKDGLERLATKLTTSEGDAVQS